MHPHKLVRDSVGFTVTQYVARALLTLRGLIAARLLGPLPYGAWNTIQLVMDYGTLAPLGTQQGLDQAVPPRIVEGDPAQLDRLKRAGLFNILLLSGLYAAVCLSYLFLRSPGKMLAFWGVSGVVVALVCTTLINLSNYHLTLLRSYGRIGAVSLWWLVQAAVGTILGLALLPAFGVWGLLLGWIAATTLATAYARWQGRGMVPLVPRHSADGKLLLRVGFPMYLYVGSSLVMRSLDRLIILRFLGTLALGYYSLAVVALGLLLYLPDSVAYVFYPQLLRSYHEAGNDPEAIRGRVERVLRLLAVLLPGLCGVAFLYARETVMAILPSYLPGTTPVRVMCFGAGALAIGNFSSIVLMTLGLQRFLVPAALFSTLLCATLDYLAVRAGYGITGVAWATFVTYGVSSLVLVWLALGGLRGPAGWRLGGVVRNFLPLFISIVLAAALDHLLPWRDSPRIALRGARLALGTVVFVALYLGACRPLTRGLGFRQVLSEINLPWLRRHDSAGS